MGFSTSHLIIVLLIVLVLFGAGKIPQIMRDLAKGVKAFKDGMKDEDLPKGFQDVSRRSSDKDRSVHTVHEDRSHDGQQTDSLKGEGYK